MYFEVRGHKLKKSLNDIAQIMIMWSTVNEYCFDTEWQSENSNLVLRLKCYVCMKKYWNDGIDRDWSNYIGYGLCRHQKLPIIAELNVHL